MKLSDVVAHLRQYCPTVSQRVAVAMEFEPDRGQVNLTVPAMVVLPADDDAQPSEYQNVSVQTVTDRFTVVLLLASADPKRGDATADALHGLRAEVWRALIGWVPGQGYEPIEYEGGEVMAMNRSLTYYAMTFNAELTVGHLRGVGDSLPDGVEPETWQEYELANLPPMDGLDIAVDVIDPIVDPNLQKPGPDGRIEFQLREDITP